MGICACGSDCFACGSPNGWDNHDYSHLCLDCKRKEKYERGFIETSFEGLILIKLKRFEDDRGYFHEVFNQESLDGEIPTAFCQDNESFSKKGTLRGLHFQHGDAAQGKLVRVVTGKVQDVVVDLREHSATYGQSVGFILDGKQMLYIPEGFAHGFLALEDTIFHYKCTSPYQKDMEGGIIWNDPDLKINWMLNHLNRDPLVSEKDQLLPRFAT